ncbi:LuxR C-terminal-related transcriptional regulator [Streptomyces salinarius]|uniref:LuxR C-terminal-related transcriptional regulator n=1 Tax=Streptomyces salinarius TaxID=2762598 RepID=UPI0016490927|nr:LuxR C-terminal-related transcriptional regulator [Streptomyces salinarius]
MLQVLGLDSSLESVYRALLTHPDDGVSDLSGRLSLSETDVRACLDQLVDLRLLQPSRETPGMLRAVSPDVGLEVILRRQEAELVRRQEELARSREAVARTVAEFASLSPRGDTAEKLVGLDSIQRRLEALTRELRQDCLAIEPGGAQSQASLDASRPLDEQALARGVQLLTVYQDSVRNDRVTLDYARWISEQGGHVRTSPILPPRMLIFDRRTAVVPIDPENTRRGALCTTAPGIVASLVALFEQTWQAAVPLGADQRLLLDDTGVSAAERELLKLLASGMTDEAAGKRLGVSLRTVRRQMAGLMERLNATSRFEAGLKAAQRGWL